MPDYGQPIRFGLFPSPSAADLQRTLELAQRAEVAGFDLLSVQDHPYQGRHLDAWTLLSVIGARTSAIRVAPNVANLPLRPPVVLAKSAATLDLLTGGRVELGLGAGAFWDGIVAAGGARRTPGESVEAIVEAIQVIRAVWGDGTVRFDGQHYRVHGLHAGPAPAHPIPIWLGAYKPRMLRVTGRHADAWVPSMGYADPPDLPALSATIDDAALAAGRSPTSIIRIYNVSGRFGRDAGFLRGTPADWAQDLARLALEVGMSTFILGTDEVSTMERFAAEVAPAVRELVEADRRQRSSAPPLSQVGRSPAGIRHGAATRVLAPTPDDGFRLSGERPWDEATRPTTREADGGEPAAYEEPGATSAQHLIDVHDALRAELAQVRSLVEQVGEGHLSLASARSVVNTMALRQNSWTLGAYCEAYCRVVTGHHTLEDRGIFPHLRAAEDGLGPVIDRLEQEHHVIAEVLERVDGALVGLVRQDGYGSQGRAALDRLAAALDLTDTLGSHLSYEERELIGPLARHGYG